MLPLVYLHTNNQNNSVTFLCLNMERLHSFSLKLNCVDFTLIITQWAAESHDIIKSLFALSPTSTPKDMHFLEMNTFIPNIFHQLFLSVCLHVGLTWVFFLVKIPGKDSALPFLQSVPLSAQNCSSVVETQELSQSWNQTHKVIHILQVLQMYCHIILQLFLLYSLVVR